MKENLSEEELLEIEYQLSFPQGEKGIEMASLMHETNAGMISEALGALKISDNHRLLEIGHGSCGHLPLVLKQAENLSYCGLEISETMQQEALRCNKAHLAPQRIEFQLYDGAIIPAADHAYDRVMSVNSLYFWQKPESLLTEIYRVMEPGGVFSLAFVQKRDMEDYPFVRSRFRLYDNEDMKELVGKTDFALAEIRQRKDRMNLKLSKYVDRAYSIAVLVKE
ncbi:MAG TPA: class I SAM-dependent methyltransferase [Bacteroidetes bacterium]|nr:class I SAM-dependent methyltransferase [Bacteroidota bacterium]